MASQLNLIYIKLNSNKKKKESQCHSEIRSRYESYLRWPVYMYMERMHMNDKQTYTYIRHNDDQSTFDVAVTSTLSTTTKLSRFD
ncbi:unnamed protein product [Adineta ricciae]|uniref:Uncharacterized protein n=1 Tax=Adineta ricciae TaxID=249248 RepID=A0A813U912_ADIRI|nr:unnamed protein product [Adineta ricciae]